MGLAGRRILVGTGFGGGNRIGGSRGGAGLGGGKLGMNGGLSIIG